MNSFEELMNHRWIVKAREKEKYYRIKDQLGTIRPFVTEKLGYRLIVNPYLIKLEKLPGEATAWMGIGEFSDPQDYSLLCFVLMFLEDKEIEQQFVLSQLTEYIAGEFPEGDTDWTIFSNRRRLVRVIKFCLKNDLFLATEGNEEEFSQNIETEALFENTGLSRYFMRSFARDIGSFTKPADFYASEWVDVDEDRGVVRRQRVYRKLLLSLGIYKTKQSEEDFAYIRNYRNLIEGDLATVTDCSLQVHRTSAYLIVGEDGDLGKLFPASNSLSDAILLFNGLLEEQRKEGKLLPDVNEIINISYLEMEEIAELCFERYGKGFAKKYREMTDEEFSGLLIDEMERLGFVDIDEVTGRISIFPIVGKLKGIYPKGF